MAAGGAGKNASGGVSAGASGGTVPNGGTPGDEPANPAAGAGAGGRSSGSGGTTATATGGVSGGSGGSDEPWPPAATFQNPVLWEDLPDIEVFRVDDTFYYTSSTFHYSPGAPVLRSYDLVNWEYVGHSAPALDFGKNYSLDGGHAYVKGIYASSLRYRPSNKTFYWIGCINGGGGGAVFTASAPEGPWEKHKAGGCYYDVGLLVDDDDTMYVAYGNTNISVAQLTPDGFGQVKAQQVYSATGMTIEGSHFFKYKENYYITVTRPADGEFVLRSSSPFGPYEIKTLIDKNRSPVSGSGVPHQGSFVETQNGDWYYMAFIDAFPGGRIPVLAPISWSSDGWPSVQLVDNAWAASYPYPKVPRPPRAVRSSLGVDTFAGTTLSPEWEWNHNPDNTKWSLNDGLVLQTATVTGDLYEARNTLTRRTRGPQSTATVQLDASQMKDGDVAGLALLRDSSAYVAIKKSAGSLEVTMVNGLTMDGQWNTTSTGTEVTSVDVSGTTIWLRASADIRPGAGREGKFSYSADGSSFTPVGSSLKLKNEWQFFLGYRYGIFNFATEALGGAITVKSFEITTP